MSKDTTKSYNIFTIFLFLVVVSPNKFFLFIYYDELTLHLLWKCYDILLLL